VSRIGLLTRSISASSCAVFPVPRTVQARWRQR